MPSEPNQNAEEIAILEAELRRIQDVRKSLLTELSEARSRLIETKRILGYLKKHAKVVLLSEYSTHLAFKVAVTEGITMITAVLKKRAIEVIEITAELELKRREQAQLESQNNILEFNEYRKST